MGLICNIECKIDRVIRMNMFFFRFFCLLSVKCLKFSIQNFEVENKNAHMNGWNRWSENAFKFLSLQPQKKPRRIEDLFFENRTIVCCFRFH